MRAWRMSLELGQPRLAIELYEAFRSAEVGQRQLQLDDAARLIRWLGAVWGGRAREQPDPIDSGPAGHAMPHETLRAAFRIARDVVSGRERDHRDGGERRDGEMLADPAHLTQRLVGADELELVARHAPTPVLEALVGACADCGDLERALQLHTFSRRLGRPLLGAPPLGSLIEALCDGGRVGDAVTLWSSYSALGLQLRNSSLTRLMSACARQRARGDAVVEQLSAQLLHGAVRLPGEGCSPEVSQIRLLAARGQLPEALSVYWQARESALPAHARLSRDGVPAHLQLLNAALYACARCSDASAALALYDECRRSHPTLPDAVSLNTLLAACAADGQPELLRAGFRSLQEAAHIGAASVRCVATLMEACESTGDATLAVHVHRWAARHHLLDPSTPEVSGVDDGAPPPSSLSASPPPPPSARGLLVDSLFHCLCPPDAILEATDSKAAAGGVDLHALVLGEPYMLDYAREAYTLARQQALPFDATLALRAIVTLSAAADRYDEATELLHAGEAHGQLLAPSELMEQRLLRRLATTYENMVLRESHHREDATKIEWGRQHAPDASVYPLESKEFARLDDLRGKVSDLCDLQPTPVSMVRPVRKEMLKSLKGELESALGDVEAQLELLGGSASTVTARTHASRKSTATKSMAASVPRSIAEE